MFAAADRNVCPTNPAKLYHYQGGRFLLANVPAAASRMAEAVTAAEQAVKLTRPNEPRPRQALEALKK